MFVSGWFRSTSRDFCESLIDVDFDLEEIHCCDSPSHDGLCHHGLEQTC